MSAIMHNAVFSELGMDYRYKLLSVEPDRLMHTVREFREPSFGGANVTIPH